MNSNKENFITTPYPNQSQSRKANGTATATMRKYQQLALAIVSVVSLMAFLFYKHEYDRLRYTLEYLEMFGSAPSELNSNTVCGNTMMNKITSAPHSWIKVGEDIAIYSSFWDEGNGYTNPTIRTIALIKKSDKPKTELHSILFYEANSHKSDICSIEAIKVRNHNKISSSDTGISIINILCKPKENLRKIPYLVQYEIGNEGISTSVQIQESEALRSVANVSCICVFSSEYPISSLTLVEFISYYNILGVEKFVFYGNFLTPLVRKLLDKYSEESSIFYEEKLFNLPNEFPLNENEIKLVIENDCIYRHRDMYENIIILKLNEYIIPRNKNTLHEILTSIGSGNTAIIPEFHLVSQNVCLDKTHAKDSDLLLGSQIQSLTLNEEKGVNVLRPHLVTGTFSYKATGAVLDVRHIPSAVANVYIFEICGSGQSHLETDHLPTNLRFVDMIKKSLLYRKWKINAN